MGSPRDRSSSRLRLADLIAPLSIVADMGFGLPPQTAMRSCLLATALGRKLGLPESEVQDGFYAALLMHIGCVSFAHETAALFGNEVRITSAVAVTNLGDPGDLEATLIPRVTEGLDARSSARLSGAIVEHAPTFARLFDTGSCEVARETARRVGLPESTQRALHETPESWQGDGAPQGLKGEEIAVSSRVARVASDAALFDDIGGVDLAVKAVRDRAGTLLDPEIVATLAANARSLFAEVNAGDPRVRILEVEPEPVMELARYRLAEVAAAFGDAVDLKSPYFHGNSGQVARHAVEAAERSGLDRGSIEELRIAALLHDIGRTGISNELWEKPGPLTAAEWEQVRIHPYHSERILATSPSLQSSTRIAGAHHERLDGSGYHRGCSASEISAAARLLAAADVYVAMTNERPHRPALEPDAAAAGMRDEARSGRLDPDAVEAVLGAAGREALTIDPPARPAGLSEREVEVLRLVARGHSNAQVAEALHISRRTAEHHVQHIYTKIGISSRPAAALFGLEHGLLS